MTEHSPWDELAVGLALGALEPEDEETFQNHLQGCTQCVQTLVDMEAVAGQLAYAAPADEPPPALLESIMREVRASERVVTPLSHPSSAPARARVRARDRVAQRPRAWESSWLTRAAVLLVVFGLGAWNYQLRADNDVKRKSIETAAAAVELMADPDATTVTLKGEGTERAKVFFKGGQAYLVVDNFPRNDKEDSIYVLWSQKAGSDVMDGVDTFKVVHDGPNYIPVRKALADSSAIAAFAVSREKGSQIPATPSKAIAVGAVEKTNTAT
ncbi:MAG: anti-sigma factor [Mycobacteriales bacterium]